MDTIVVPLDGSALAERVLPHVRGLARMLGARVCLLQAIWDVDYDDMMAESLLSAYAVGDSARALQERRGRDWNRRRGHAEGYLTAQALHLQEADLAVETEVHVGSPEEIIVEVARRHQATLIAMATHGYGGLKRWTLGSVTDKVVHTATRPVFVVRGGEVAPPVAPPIKRILVPLDGSELARQALPLALELAGKADAELILLEAIAPMIERRISIYSSNQPTPRRGAVLELLRRQAECELESVAGELRQSGLRATCAAVNGHAAEIIVDEAARREVDMIVMATHGYSGLKRWALGSVADKVLHTATKPLALVRAQPHEEQIGAGVSDDALSTLHIRP